MENLITNPKTILKNTYLTKRASTFQRIKESFANQGLGCTIEKIHFGNYMFHGSPNFQELFINTSSDCGYDNSYQARMGRLEILEKNATKYLNKLSNN